MDDRPNATASAGVFAFGVVIIVRDLRSSKGPKSVVPTDPAMLAVSHIYDQRGST